MGKEYNFSWVLEKAKRLEFGEIVVKLVVQNGQVMKVLVVSELESRTLEESNQKQKESLL